MQQCPSSLSSLAQLLRLGLLGAGFGLSVSAAQAQSLLALYDQALRSDAPYRAAQAGIQAAQAKVEQAKAALRPSASLSLSSSRALNDSASQRTETGSLVDNPQRNFGSSNAAVNGSFPIYRPLAKLGLEQSQHSAQLSEIQRTNAEQDLIMRLAQAYFDTLAAQDQVQFLQAQKKAVAEQRAFAQKSFEIGNSTITDSRDAQAKFDLISAQEYNAHFDLQSRHANLAQTAGVDRVQPLPLRLPFTPPALAPNNLEAWVKAIVSASTPVQVAKKNRDIAQLELEKANASDGPTLDLDGSVGASRSHNGSAASTLNNRSYTGNLALRFNMPLYTGQANQNRVVEAQALLAKADAELEAATRNATQNARTLYYATQSTQALVQAYQTAEASSLSSLQATKLGYQVGIRISLDLLSVQSQLSQTQRDLAQARYNSILSQLRLKQAAAQLRRDDLIQISHLLKTDPSSVLPAPVASLPVLTPASGAAPASTAATVAATPRSAARPRPTSPKLSVATGQLDAAGSSSAAAQPVPQPAAVLPLITTVQQQPLPAATARASQNSGSGIATDSTNSSYPLSPWGNPAPRLGERKVFGNSFLTRETGPQAGSLQQVPLAPKNSRR